MYRPLNRKGARRATGDLVAPGDNGMRPAPPDGASAGGRSRPNLLRAFSSLDEPVFRRWFFSQIFSASGSMTQSVAMAWLVLRLTGKGIDLGLMTSCSLLPLLLGGSWAGALVDRVDRRRLLIVTQSLFIGLSSLLAVLVATGTVRLWMLFLLAAVTGMVNAPDAAARQVYVVELVGRERPRAR